MRFTRPILPALCATAVVAAAPDARATPIAVAFEGTFTYDSGSPVSIPFTGLLFYDSDTPNTGVSPPSALYQFAPGSAGIRIEAGGAIYASAPDSPDVYAGSVSVWLDQNGQIASPNDPDGMPGSLLHWTSFGSNLPSDVFSIQIEATILEIEPALPGSADALAAELVGAGIGVSGQGTFALGGTISSAAPIPEPSSPALLLLGLALLALRRRRAAGDRPGHVAGVE